MELERAHVWKTEGDLIWILCPACGRKITDPFSRFDLPRYHQHRMGQCNRDLIVVPCAATGRHQVELLENGALPEGKLIAHLRDRRTVHHVLSAAWLLTEHG